MKYDQLRSDHRPAPSWKKDATDCLKLAASIALFLIIAWMIG